ARSRGELEGVPLEEGGRGGRVDEKNSEENTMMIDDIGELDVLEEEDAPPRSVPPPPPDESGG
ncbi:MAG: hypothetical protein ACOC97_05725, partial [Myxococcota bacterium]